MNLIEPYNPRFVFTGPLNFRLRQAGKQLNKLKTKTPEKHHAAQNKLYYYRSPRINSHRSERDNHLHQSPTFSEFSLQFQRLDSPPKQTLYGLINPIKRAITSQLRKDKKPLVPNLIEERNIISNTKRNVSQRVAPNSCRLNKTCFLKSLLKTTELKLDLRRDRADGKSSVKRYTNGDGSDRNSSIKNSSFSARKNIQLPQKSQCKSHTKIEQPTILSILKEYQSLNSKTRVKIWDLQFNGITNKRNYNRDR